ncbi:MAG: hypothetical protein Q9219_004980 [cf. Caloplaca sp. 3 TL-2023]
MDKAIIQALGSLIPEFNGPFPQDLLELAVSLLALSRNKAGNLRADEEIARSYACAHLACESRNDERTEDDRTDRLRSLSIEALIVAVYIPVHTRLAGEPNNYRKQRDETLAILRELRSDELSSTVLNHTEVDKWMEEIQKGDWLEMDWFENIEAGAGLGLSESRGRVDDSSSNSDVDNRETHLVSKRTSSGYTAEKPYLQPGLGTMMQDRVDYLSDEKRADYQRWMNNILARIARIEKVLQV